MKGAAMRICAIPGVIFMVICAVACAADEKAALAGKPKAQPSSQTTGVGALAGQPKAQPSSQTTGVGAPSVQPKAQPPGQTTGVGALAGKPKAQPSSQTTGVGAPSVQPKAQGLDMVTDTAVGLVRKANALLEGKLEVTMSKDADKIAAAEGYTVNAIGMKVPKSTAVKDGDSLHSNQPL